uniref:Uncharacterized protein n=1 Tax=Ascaris lumbricoides TaxID=6252 RepID=A0A0M3HJ08_ASCLU
MVYAKQGRLVTYLKQEKIRNEIRRQTVDNAQPIMVMTLRASAEAGPSETSNLPVTSIKIAKLKIRQRFQSAPLDICKILEDRCS